MPRDCPKALHIAPTTMDDLFPRSSTRNPSQSPEGSPYRSHVSSPSPIPRAGIRCRNHPKALHIVPTRPALLQSRMGSPLSQSPEGSPYRSHSFARITSKVRLRPRSQSPEGSPYRSHFWTCAFRAPPGIGRNRPKALHIVPTAPLQSPWKTGSYYP